MSGEGEATGSARDARARLLNQRHAAQDERAWVRLTRACNNRCLFCLDAESHDGRHEPDAEVQARMRAGRQRGATRLILSGGEPTVHPHFLRFVALGRALGYRHIQVITNGRMLSYPRFVERALAAGLGEVTISLHGHSAELHDRLVGVPGAYAQAMGGLEAALATRRLVVSVDVCLNRLNLPHLGQMLRELLALGVREFDLLHLIPFGRAWEPEQRDVLAYELADAAPYFAEALALSRRDDVHIWFNRLPAAYLEGFEHLIQEPYKLCDEARGRHEDFAALLDDGVPLFCREPHRCERCYLRGLCDALHDWRARLVARRFDVYRVDAALAIRAAPVAYETLWVRAANASLARAAARQLPGAALILECDDYDGLVDELRTGVLDGKRVARVYAPTPRALSQLLGAGAAVQIVAYLSWAMVERLVAEPALAPQLVLAARNHPHASEAAAWDADFERWLVASLGARRVENLPPCLGGALGHDLGAVLDVRMLRRGAASSLLPGSDPARPLVDRGRGSGGHIEALDVLGCVDEFVREHFYVKSLRCAACAWTADCRGAHINFVRAHGFALLQPRRQAKIE